jgi:TPR repeat protein
MVLMRSGRITAALAAAAAFLAITQYPLPTAQAQFRDFSAERAKAAQMLAQGDQAGFLRMLRELSAAGDTQSQETLGGVLVRRKEFAEAEMWLKRAASSGSAEAKWHLYGLNSLKSPPDPAAADKWLRAAAADGLQKARDILDDMRLTPKPVGGRMDLQSLIKLARHYSNRKISRFDEGQLACYKLSREELLAASDKAFQSCHADVLRAYGRSVAMERAHEVMTEMAQCTNNKIFASGNTSASEMLLCFTALDPSAKDVQAGPR